MLKSFDLILFECFCIIKMNQSNTNAVYARLTRECPLKNGVQYYFDAFIMSCLLLKQNQDSL